MKDMKKLVFSMGLGMLILASCTTKQKTTVTTLSGLNPQNFVTEVNGEATKLFTLKNTNGMEVCITNLEEESFPSWYPIKMAICKMLFWDSTVWLTILMFLVTSAHPSEDTLTV